MSDLHFHMSLSGDGAEVCCAIPDSPGVIRMDMREHDCTRTDAFQFSQPIKTGIDHHVCRAIRKLQRRMHAMPSRSCFVLAARAQECQSQCERLVLFLDWA